MCEKLEHIKIQLHCGGLDTLTPHGVTEWTKDISWLIEQAEKLEKIQKLSKAEEITIADFTKEVLKVIEGREVPTRYKRD